MNICVDRCAINPIISVQELVGLHDDVLIVDCRHDLMNHDAGAQAYAEGHLPGAAFLRVEDDLSGPKSGRNGRHPLPTPQAFAQTLAALGANENTLIIGYDASAGMFASRLWWLCRWIGHLKCGVLDGGFQAWCAADGPLSQDPFHTKRTGKISVRPSLAPLWTHEHVSAWLESGSDPEIALMIDARAPERFRGDVEPLDPVAGHIPGSINRAFAHNLGPDGRFKPASQLHQEFSSLLNDRDPMCVVHSCGSGVTACHNLLAMEIAGLPGSALYAGSWSEWCADPSRPVAKGD
jgi:thiosulfate/3-mercaptopyruvate sulfurtransferase